MMARPFAKDMTLPALRWEGHLSQWFQLSPPAMGAMVIPLPSGIIDCHPRSASPNRLRASFFRSHSQASASADEAAMGTVASPRDGCRNPDTLAVTPGASATNWRERLPPSTIASRRAADDLDQKPLRANLD